MGDIKWIKLAVGLPNNRQLNQIRKLPNGDSIALMYVYLLCLAGEVNECGLIYLTPEVPYTDEMLATEFRMDLNTVRLGLESLRDFGLIDIVDNIISLPTWEKWQSTDKLTEIRDQTRKRVAKHREKQRIATSNVTCNVTVTQCNATEEEIEEEIDKDIKKKSKKETTHTLFNRLISDYVLSENLKAKLEQWIVYKTERKEAYQEQGLKTLLRRIENSAKEYGDAAIINLIDDSMSSGWKGIIFDRLKKQEKQPIRQEVVPKWIPKQQNDYDFDSLERELLGEPDPAFLERKEKLQQRLKEKYGKEKTLNTAGDYSTM